MLIVPKAQLPAEAGVPLSAEMVSMCTDAMFVQGLMSSYQLVEEKHCGIRRSHHIAELCLGCNELFTFRFYLSFQ